MKIGDFGLSKMADTSAPEGVWGAQKAFMVERELVFFFFLGGGRALLKILKYRLENMFVL